MEKFTVRNGHHQGRFESNLIAIEIFFSDDHFTVQRYRNDGEKPSSEAQNAAKPLNSNCIHNSHGTRPAKKKKKKESSAHKVQSVNSREKTKKKIIANRCSLLNHIRVTRI